MRHLTGKKLEQSVNLACRKRGVEQERIDQLVSGIQRQVETAGDQEVPSKRIGELVMGGLRQIDSVAYIRFASVYRDFLKLETLKSLLVQFTKLVPAMTEMAPNNQPAFVLVRPQLGENIGKAARAMLNFGLTDLRIVAPRDGWPNPDAGPSAAGADEILEKAQVFQTTAEALQDCRNVYATTVRKRGLSKPVLDPKKQAKKFGAMSSKVQFYSDLNALG